VPTIAKKSKFGFGATGFHPNLKHKDDNNGLTLAHINQTTAPTATKPTLIPSAILSRHGGRAWSCRIWPLGRGQKKSPE
jgi:hypothetical protein